MFITLKWQLFFISYLTLHWQLSQWVFYQTRNCKTSFTSYYEPKNSSTNADQLLFRLSIFGFSKLSASDQRERTEEIHNKVVEYVTVEHPHAKKATRISDWEHLQSYSRNFSAITRILTCLTLSRNSSMKGNQAN